MDDLIGKRLLFLGGTGFMCAAVEKAKSMGIHTIVTDYLPNQPAKAIADQREDISTTDIDALAEFCRDNRVDGVFSSYDDLNSYSAQALCERMGYPFHLAKHQLDATANKLNFKELCRKHGVPTVKEYPLDARCIDEDLERMEYPVIIKPADSYASKGISVCHSEAELIAAVPKALSFSRVKQVIVEKFLSEELYEDFRVDYLFQNGNAHLAFACERFTNAGRNLPVGGVYPSVYLDEYMSDTDIKVKEMFRSIGIKNGCAFMQAFHNHEGFHFYEMALRMPGSFIHVPLQEETGIDLLEGMIRLALAGEFFTFDVANLMQPTHQKYYFDLVLSCTGGTISRIEGLDEARAAPFVLNVTQAIQPGNTVLADGTQRQILFRIWLKAETLDILVDEIKLLQKSVVAYDQDNKPMMAELFDVSKIYNERRFN